MNLLVLLYNKKQSCYCHCVSLQREQYMGAHCVKPIKIQSRHIASCLPSHVGNVLLSHHSCQSTCVHCIKSSPLSAPSQISQHHISVSVSRTPQSTRGPERAPGERGKFHIIYPSAIYGSDVQAGNELWTSSLHAHGPSGHQPTYWDQVGIAESGLIDPSLIGLLFVNGRNPDALL